jgi:2-iminobutanoate/2-iminopropanoate deaminase
VKQVITTSDAPKAIGPYSQAIVSSSGLIYTAGTLGADPTTGELVGPGIQEQTRQALTNLAAVLRAAGSGLDKVLKTTVFLADMKDFAAMNEVYAEFFGTVPPARSTVQVAGLPKGARVEIEAVAERV